MYILIIPLVYFIVNTYTLTHEIPRLLPLFQSNSVVTLSRGLKCFFPVTSDELSISTSLELNTISGASEQENIRYYTYSAEEVNIQPFPIKYWVPKMMMIRL